MHRRQFLALGASLPFLPQLSWAQMDEFERYKQQQLQAFSAYEIAINEAFEAYKRLHDVEFANYKASISQRWAEAEVSQPTKWVTYDSSLAHKLVIDYEKGEVRIESVTPPTGQQRAEIMAMIEQVNRSNLTQLIQRDPVDVALNNFSQQQNTLLSQMAESPKTTIESAPVLQRPVQVQTSLPAAQVVTTEKGQALTSYVMPLPAGALNEREKRYLVEVNKQAKQWQIEASLIMAITKCESAFNPLAKSHVPAYGLMQIVPKSAGMDATKLIYGQSRLVSPNYLYTPPNNVQMGAAYLHILQYRYLKDIKNPQSRMYCVIAAYNTGPGNVARAFTGATQLGPFYARVNSMTPTQVHSRLLSHLPFDETKTYLHKVLAAKQGYQALV